MEKKSKKQNQLGTGEKFMQFYNDLSKFAIEYKHTYESCLENLQINLNFI